MNPIGCSVDRSMSAETYIKWLVILLQKYYKLNAESHRAWFKDAAIKEFLYNCIMCQNIG